MKAAIYCRVSTEGQHEAKTIDAQKQECQDYCEKKGYEIAEVYIDDGISGAFLSGREGCERMLADALHRKFDVVVVTESSRITRTESIREKGLIYGTFQETEIPIESTSGERINWSNPGDRLKGEIGHWFAEEERRRISDRMKRGRKAKFLNGQYCRASLIYGLRKRTERIGKEVKHIVELDSEQSDVLRNIVYPKVVDEEGCRLPASYTNFYIGNTKVLVPVFDHPNDEKALTILQELFPTRKVVGVCCKDLVYGFGTLHCISQQQPCPA